MAEAPATSQIPMTAGNNDEGAPAAPEDDDAQNHGPEGNGNDGPEKEPARCLGRILDRLIAGICGEVLGMVASMNPTAVRV